MKPDPTEEWPRDATPEEVQMQSAMDTLLRVRLRGAPVQAKWARVAEGIQAARNTRPYAAWHRPLPLLLAAALLAAGIAAGVWLLASRPIPTPRTPPAHPPEQPTVVPATTPPGPRAVPGAMRTSYGYFHMVLDATRTAPAAAEWCDCDGGFAVRRLPFDSPRTAQDAAAQLRVNDPVEVQTVFRDDRTGSCVLALRRTPLQSVYGRFAGVSSNNGPATLRWTPFGEAGVPREMPLAPDAWPPTGRPLQPDDPVFLVCTTSDTPRVVAVRAVTPVSEFGYFRAADRPPPDAPAPASVWYYATPETHRRRELHWTIRRLGETDLEQTLPMGDPEPIIRACATLRPDDPIEIVTDGRGPVLAVRPSTPESVAANMRELGRRAQGWQGWLHREP